MNEAFVKRFFKPEEDPLDQHFGLNLPENVNHFRIVGVIADARFQSFRTDDPCSRCSTCRCRSASPTRTR